MEIRQAEPVAGEGPSRAPAADASDLPPAVRAYLDAWNATDADVRRARIADAYAPGATYTDPMAHATGAEEIDAMIAGVQATFPDHRFVPASVVDEHHGCMRFAWTMVGPGGETALEGIDVAIADDHGRLRRVVGFFGDLAPLPS